MNFRGCGKKPVEKPSAARFARPLRGAEVLVAVRGPSPGEGGGKKRLVIYNLTILDFKTKMQYGKVYISRPGNPMDLWGQCQRRAADVDALLREERANFRGLVLGCIEAKFCK